MKPPPFTLTGRRSSGLLLHPSSLPGPHGGGDLGRASFEFVDLLRSAGQRWWQMLPVGPPGAAPGHSPYSSTSAFAGSPFLISLERLAEDGLLDRADLRAPADVARRGDAAAVQAFRTSRLRRAFDAFCRDGSGGQWRHELDAFRRDHRRWLDEFALFSAVRVAQSERSWLDWPGPLRLRQRSAVLAARRQLGKEVRFHEFVQFVFERQWAALRSYCHSSGVGLIGDIPIFVALDSADVWAHPKLFLLDRAARPRVVSGCPPDAFCAEGQLWGHPHYDWPAHRRSRFDWWVGRFESMMRRFDAVRIDHFLGFNRAWAVPAKAATARRGRWLAGPGDDLFRAVRKACGAVPIIAEDLGAVTPEAMRLRDRWKFPGMRVMQFGFGDGGQYHLPHHYPRRSVAYTGTHDNQTAVGWFQSLARRNGHAPADHVRRAREKAVRYLGVRDARHVHWDMIRAAMLSPADTVIFPVQDVLGLDDSARMNVPGVAKGQWGWRMRDGKQLTPSAAKRLRDLVHLSDRQG